MTAVLVSSCNGSIFTTINGDDFAVLWHDILDFPDDCGRYHMFGRTLAARCAMILREIHRGRGGEFCARSSIQAVTRRLLELGTIGSEAGDGPVDIRR